MRMRFGFNFCCLLRDLRLAIFQGLAAVSDASDQKTSTAEMKFMQIVQPAFLPVPAEWKNAHFQEREARFAIGLWQDMGGNPIRYLKELEPGPKRISRKIFLGMESVRAAAITGFDGSMGLLPSLPSLDPRPAQSTSMEDVWTDNSVGKRLCFIYIWLLFVHSQLHTKMSPELTKAYTTIQHNLINLAHFHIHQIKAFHDKDDDLDMEWAVYTLPYGSAPGCFKRESIEFEFECSDE